MNYRLIAAAVILALYAGLAMVMFLSAGAWQDQQWTHALAIFTAFGAMATAAASVLLGVEVQRTNVEAAERRSDEAMTQLGALREAHRIALNAAADGPGLAAQSLPADQRLAMVRAVLGQAG